MPPMKTERSGPLSAVHSFETFTGCLSRSPRRDYSPYGPSYVRLRISILQCRIRPI
jgi:hypothetical protein